MPSIIAPLIEYFPSPEGGYSVARATWAAMANGDVGEAWAAPSWRVRNVMAIGTFGTGGKVAMQGSNLGIPRSLSIYANVPYPVAVPTSSDDFAALHGPDYQALEMTAKGLFNILEAPLFTRPAITAGDVTTALNVIMMVFR